MAKTSWDDFAVLLVDLQQDFWSAGIAESAPEMPANVAALVAGARERRVLVVHVRSEFSPDGSDWMARYRIRGRIPCVVGTPGVESLGWVSPAEGEPRVVKHTFDAFLGTALEELLRERGVRYVLIGGLVTSTCVFLSAASAMQRGFLVSVVEDCCADHRGRHDATLDGYRFVFDRVTADEVWTQRARFDEQLALAFPDTGRAARLRSRSA